MTFYLLVTIFVFVISLLMLALLQAKVKQISQLNKPYYHKHWQRITSLKNDRLALIEADKLLDQALKDRQLGGDTMKDRLVSAEKHFRHPEDVWQAHKLRNRLVHEVDFKLPKPAVIKANLAYFRQALDDLGAF